MGSQSLIHDDKIQKAPKLKSFLKYMTKWLDKLDLSLYEKARKINTNTVS